MRVYFEFWTFGEKVEMVQLLITDEDDKGIHAKMLELERIKLTQLERWFEIENRRNKTYKSKNLSNCRVESTVSVNNLESLI